MEERERGGGREEEVRGQKLDGTRETRLGREEREMGRGERRREGEREEGNRKEGDRCQRARDRGTGDKRGLRG